MNQFFIPFPLLFIFFIHCTLTSAQSPAAAPAPPGPTNLTAILEKAGRFNIFIRLLQSTKVGDQIHTQLNDSNQGLTVFAPTDTSFSSLKTGTLNSLSDDRKMELMQFHVLPSYFSPSQFQTASNPLRTQAGGSQELFSMNVTAIGNQVNITTGETNATVASTIYTDNQLAVYEVDQVLLPVRFFRSPPPTPAPVKPKKAARSPKAPPSTPVESSTANCLSKQVFHAMACVVIVLAATP
ncbi:hypothetical protein Pfo_004263 [Paulownia fortunei]|nr:hypothetical protein Pfo_004263 [Paulownia fortunei]